MQNALAGSCGGADGKGLHKVAPRSHLVAVYGGSTAYFCNFKNNDGTCGKDDVNDAFKLISDSCKDGQVGKSSALNYCCRMLILSRLCSI